MAVQRTGKFRSAGGASPAFKRVAGAIEAALESHSGRIVSARRNRGPLLQRQSSQIKLAAYDLGHRFSGKRDQRHLESYIAHRLKNRTPQTPIFTNVYRWLIALILDEGDLAFAREVLARWADELLYAERHRMPPHLLIGFIAQAGGSERIRCELESNRTEPWFTTHLRWLEEPQEWHFPNAI